MTDYSIDPEVLSILEKFSTQKNLALERLKSLSCIEQTMPMGLERWKTFTIWKY